MQLLIKLQSFQKIRKKIIQGKLQMTNEKYISPEKRQKIIDNLRWIITVK